MNEATFEAMAHKAIEKIFPSYARLELTHQLIFSIKLGHKDVEVKPHVRKPRLDILIKKKGRNLAVLELKNPEIPLKEEDRSQGLSYARLLDPMPPLVIVSNGVETRFYQTVSGDPLDITNPNSQQLENQFTQALEIAATEREQAIQILLGKDPLIWEKVIEDLNQRSFQNLLGSIDTLYQPISNSFLLPRQRTQYIIDLVSRHNSIVAVTGAPLVGKTNVLYEICQSKDIPFVPIYINAEDCEYGIFQYLANHFTKHFFSATSTKDVRQWLLHGIISNRHIAGKTVLIVDGVHHSNNQVINDIKELIDLCSSSTSCSLVIACDSSNYNLMAHIPGRPGKTLFGKRALKVEISNLNDEEFNDAQEYLKKHLNLDFHNGAQYSRELRNPRIIRMIVSELPLKKDQDTRFVLPSFLPFRSLSGVLEGFNSDPRFIDDMVKLVKSSMKQDLESPSHLMESMVSYGRGYISYERAEELLGETRIGRLLKQGHIDWFTDTENNRYIAPKVPELLAATAVEALFREVSKMDFDKATNHVLKMSERLPYGDLIAANVFVQLSNDPQFPLHNLIAHLSNEPPRIEKVGEDFKGAMYFDNTGLVTISQEFWKESSEEIRMISNVFPWLVLSQLATAQMMVEDEEDPWWVYRAILKTVGGYQNILRRFDPVDTPENIMGYNTHTLQSKNGEQGEVLCGEVGIIETITYAMQLGFYLLPDELLKVCEFAVKEKDPFLNHRLYNAAYSIIDINEEAAARAVKQAISMLKAVH